MRPWDKLATYPGRHQTYHLAFRPMTVERGSSRPLAGETLKMNRQMCICAHLKLINKISYILIFRIISVRTTTNHTDKQCTVILIQRKRVKHLRRTLH